MTLEIREARPADVPLVYAFIRNLAEYEKLLHEVEAREEDIAQALFGPTPRCQCALAFWNGAPAGFALTYYIFSTFAGKSAIYLEDLYVEPAYRRRGIGKALLVHLARRCVAEGLSRLQWAVLDWNAPSIAVYQGLGARPIDDWTLYRLEGEALKRLAS